MLLTVYNGSPRGPYGSTAAITSHFLKGFTDAGHHAYQLIYLSPRQTTDTQLRFFQQADTVLLAFPLYTSSMPAMVKGFIEAWEPLAGKRSNPKLGFLVHSSLPEAFHARPVERYLEKLTKRMGSTYLGTIIKSGVHPSSGDPGRMSRRLRQAFYLLGKNFAATGQFNTEFLHALAQPEKLSPFWLRTLTCLTRAGLTNYYWDRQMLTNNALDKRFAEPYKPHPGL